VCKQYGASEELCKILQSVKKGAKTKGCFLHAINKLFLYVSKQHQFQLKKSDSGAFIEDNLKASDEGDEFWWTI
jgi:hypothetical protein